MNSAEVTAEPTRFQHIGVKTALKRLISPDFQAFDPAARRVAWEVIMAEGNPVQRKAAHQARDKYPFPAK